MTPDYTFRVLHLGPHRLLTTDAPITAGNIGALGVASTSCPGSSFQNVGFVDVLGSLRRASTPIVAIAPNVPMSDAP